jgi:ribosomal protein S18 acetylase RimI-like enzyme
VPPEGGRYRVGIMSQPPANLHQQIRMRRTASDRRLPPCCGVSSNSSASAWSDDRFPQRCGPGDDARNRGVRAFAVATTDFEVAVPYLEDAEELASVHVQAWREAYGELLPEHFYDNAARASRQVMWSGRLSEEAGRERIRVARRQGRIVGFVLQGPATEHQGNAPVRNEQLYALYVVSSAYGHGVGQALLDQALGGRPAQLWVAKNNGRARRFYEKNGFTADGTEQADPDLDGLVEIRMVR